MEIMGAVVVVGTRVKVERFWLSPSPNCPLPLLPQAYTRPSDVRRKEWKDPAMMETMGAMVVVGTRVKVELSSLSPSPNCPHPLSPQAYTRPSDVRCRECEDPVTMEIMGAVVVVGTRVKVERLLVSPSPNCPYLLYPQAYTRPSDVRRKEW